MPSLIGPLRSYTSLAGNPHWLSDLLAAFAATLVSALAPVPLLDGVPSCASSAAAAASAAFFASASLMA
jgi:hypothetical protein